MLAECEKIYKHSIPNIRLSSLKTAEDVEDYFTNLQPPVKRMDFPSIDYSQLPPNLSLDHIQRTKPQNDKQSRRRKPFDNFSDPKHAQFPGKRKQQRVSISPFKKHQLPPSKTLHK